MNELRERKAQLYLQHPEERPELIDVMPYLILKQVEAILAWRVTVAPENRFWKAD
jgi:hypothetical protein